MKNTVSEIMKHNIECIGSNTLVEDALLFMAQNKIRSVPVVDKGIYRGIITEDELVSVLKPFGTLSNVTISPWITEKIAVANPCMSIDEVSELIVQQQFICLPVVENKKLVGTVSLEELSNTFNNQ